MGSAWPKKLNQTSNCSAFEILVSNSTRVTKQDQKTENLNLIWFG